MFLLKVIVENCGILNRICMIFLKENKIYKRRLHSMFIFLRKSYERQVISCEINFDEHSLFYENPYHKCNACSVSIILHISRTIIFLIGLRPTKVSLICFQTSEKTAKLKLSTTNLTALVLLLTAN